MTINSPRSQIHNLLNLQITWGAVFALLKHNWTGWVDKYVLTTPVKKVLDIETIPVYSSWPIFVAEDITFLGLLGYGGAKKVNHKLYFALLSRAAAAARLVISRMLERMGTSAGRYAARRVASASFMAIPGVGWVVNGGLAILDSYLLVETINAGFDLRTDLVNEFTEVLCAGLQP